MIFRTNRLCSGVKSVAVKATAVDERFLLAGSEISRVQSAAVCGNKIMTSKARGCRVSTRKLNGRLPTGGVSPLFDPGKHLESRTSGPANRLSAHTVACVIDTNAASNCRMQ